MIDKFEQLETQLKDKSKESDHFRLLCGTWRHKAEELEKENANKDLLLKQKTERINELEKENKSLKDTNFMVENFHKVCKELEEIKEKNSFKYVNKLSENNRQLEKENDKLKELVVLMGERNE
jgi:hypothetical protein